MRLTRGFSTPTVWMDGLRNPCDFKIRKLPGILSPKPHAIWEPQFVASRFTWPY